MQWDSYDIFSKHVPGCIYKNGVWSDKKPVEPQIEYHHLGEPKAPIIGIKMEKLEVVIDDKDDVLHATNSLQRMIKEIEQ